MANELSLDKFGLNINEVQILYNLEYLKTMNDISQTQNEQKKALKEKWLNEWKSFIEMGFKSFTNQNTIGMNWCDTTTLLQAILNNNPKEVWFRLVLLETMLFTPYYALSTEKDKKGNEVPCKTYNSIKPVSTQSGDDFLEITFRPYVYYTQGYIARLRKCYKKVINELNEVVKATLISVGVFVAVLVPLIFVAGAFSGPIAVALVGSNFAGLSGAALTSACLAFLGGGAIAAGGAGIAGGTVAIVGGGALLGAGLGAGAGIAAGASNLIGKQNTILQSAKLLVAVREIFLNDEKDIAYSDTIYEQYSNNLIELEKKLTYLERNKNNGEGDQKQLKIEIKELKDSIKAMQIAKKSLAKFSSSFKTGVNAS